MGTLSALDWAVVAGYFLLIYVVSYLSTRGKGRQSDAAGYFLAGKDCGWFVIGASLFASAIGSEHLVGLAGAGAARGVAVSHFEIMACFCLLVLGWLFVPFYLRSGVFTMPEFLELRYGRGARTYLAVISIVGYVLTKISVTIAAGGIVFQTLMGLDFWTGAVLIVVATGVYTVFGGLRAVLYTDMIQMFVFIGGAVLVTLAGLDRLGGVHELTRSVGPEFFNLWKPMSDPEYPWTGIIFGIPVLGLWYWCTDQFIVQRVLAASDVRQARLGTIFAGYLKLLPLFIFVLPGIIALALSRSGALHLESTDSALPAMIGALLPAGVRGIVVAGLIAALMSSLSSVFNSCSTLITWDIYRRLRPAASELQLVRAGKVSTVGIVILGLLWIPLIRLLSKGLFTYLQSVQACISPPIAAVFLFGLLWRRVNARGAMAALLSGFVLGLARLVLEINKSSLSGCLFRYADLNFLHFAIALFAFCSAVLVAVSLTAPAPGPEKLDKVCLAGAAAAGGQAGRRPLRLDSPLAMTILLLVLVAVIYLCFRG
ncbi:sodium:solute symporter [bacterium]|nr:sodium:solute symporter [bacterium]